MTTRDELIDRAREYFDGPHGDRTFYDIASFALSYGAEQRAQAIEEAAEACESLGRDAQHEGVRGASWWVRKAAEDIRVLLRRPVEEQAETIGPSAGTQGHGSLNVQPRPQAGEASATQRTVCQPDGNAGAATRQPIVSAPFTPLAPSAACLWTIDDDEAAWKGACGRLWYIDQSATHMLYCPGCGKRIEVRAEADLFERVASEWKRSPDETLESVLRRRFGETVAALEQIAKHPCARDGFYSPLPCPCVVHIARAELARLKSGGAQHG